MASRRFIGRDACALHGVIGWANQRAHLGSRDSIPNNDNNLFTVTEAMLLVCANHVTCHDIQEGNPTHLGYSAIPILLGVERLFSMRRYQGNFGQFFFVLDQNVIHTSHKRNILSNLCMYL